MTLSPEDVLNKNFTPTQFRRGYDEREVDDFLDEVVAEMRKLVKDSDDLRDQLNECRESKGMPTVAKPESQERIAALAAQAQEAEQAAQQRIAEANAKAQEAERTAQARADEAEQ